MRQPLALVVRNGSLESVDLLSGWSIFGLRAGADVRIAPRGSYRAVVWSWT